MKLSQAIRLGATVLPQTQGGYFKVVYPEGDAACAMGMAAYAIGFRIRPSYSEQRLEKLSKSEWP
jgi:hypothetical protein